MSKHVRGKLTQLVRIQIPARKRSHSLCLSHCWCTCLFICMLLCVFTYNGRRESIYLCRCTKAVSPQFHRNGYKCKPGPQEVRCTAHSTKYYRRILVRTHAQIFGLQWVENERIVLAWPGWHNQNKLQI